MNIPTKPQRHHRGAPGAGAAGLGIGAVMLMVLCCAGPALLAGGVLTAVGTWLTNPWVIAAGAVIALSAVALAVHHRRAQTPCNVTDPCDRRDDCRDTHADGA